MVHEAAREVRAVSTEFPDAPPADTRLVVLRRVVDDVVAGARAMGELILEVAPTCLSGSTVFDGLGPLCDAIGEDIDIGLATRRYALTGDGRARHGTR
ncbi:hypothetical protein ACFYYB_33775 [Streptomyces sp. NPDC002886]|uniref:hypothetical protein n=1 Tax=Streptomyces sp. NPDC002886 TaxID=3364667 RepID=UPI0036BCC6B9